MGQRGRISVRRVYKVLMEIKLLKLIAVFNEIKTTSKF